MMHFGLTRRACEQARGDAVCKYWRTAGLSRTARLCSDRATTATVRMLNRGNFGFARVKLELIRSVNIFATPGTRRISSKYAIAPCLRNICQFLFQFGQLRKEAKNSEATSSSKQKRDRGARLTNQTNRVTSWKFQSARLGFRLGLIWSSWPTIAHFIPQLTARAGLN